MILIALTSISSDAVLAFRKQLSDECSSLSLRLHAKKSLFCSGRINS